MANDQTNIIIFQNTNTLYPGALITINVATQPPLKLTSTNYLMWKLINSYPYQNGLLLSQQPYIIDLLTHIKMAKANLVSTLLLTSSLLFIHIGFALYNLIEYRVIVCNACVLHSLT